MTQYFNDPDPLDCPIQTYSVFRKVGTSYVAISFPISIQGTGTAAQLRVDTT